MLAWLRTALQYAPLAERAGRGLARFVRRLRGRQTPSLEDAIEANERAQEAIERERAQLEGEDTPTESPRAKARSVCSVCGSPYQLVDDDPPVCLACSVTRLRG